jgi:hypothetical protein
MLKCFFLLSERIGMRIFEKLCEGCGEQFTARFQQRLKLIDDVMPELLRISNVLRAGRCVGSPFGRCRLVRQWLADISMRHRDAQGRNPVMKRLTQFIDCKLLHGEQDERIGRFRDSAA